MNLTTIFTTLATTVPATSEWNLTVGVVMVLCNIAGVLIAQNWVQKKGVGASFPLGDNFSVGQFVGGTAFGHLLGAGVILGLTNMGVI
jgi:photosystem I subunit X